MEHDVTSTLNHLIETLKDGENGYRTAAEEAKRPDIKQILSEYSAQRAKFASELQSQVAARGEDPKDSGTVGGAMMRGWMNVKAAFTSNDDLAVLESCEKGEDTAVKEFQEAIAGGDLGNAGTIVSRQFTEIRNAHDKIKALRNSLRGAAAHA